VQLQLELSASMEKAGYDFVILDGELLPWSLKAGSLVDLLSSPGECAQVSREYCYGSQSNEYNNAKKFVEALSHYVQKTPPQYRVFQILAAGKVVKNELVSKKMGAYMPVPERYNLIKQLESDMIKCTEYRVVPLHSIDECAAAVKAWEEYCRGGGEGWVVKAYPNYFSEDQSGSVVLPMLKVRGIDYLRLVYGIDYLEPQYYKYLLDRSISSKRQLARKQEELADNILKSFIKGYPQLTQAFSAAFYAVDYQKINATL